METKLRPALKRAAERHGAPMVCAAQPHDRTYTGVFFGPMDIHGRHEEEFLISINGFTVYHKRPGLTTDVCDGRVLKGMGVLVDAMATYAEQFVPPKPAPCTALLAPQEARHQVVLYAFMQMCVIPLRHTPAMQDVLVAEQVAA